MNILVKFPTRSRPLIFLEVLGQYVESSGDDKSIHYLVTIDEDDKTMDDAVVALAKKITKNITFDRGYSTSKINACNRGIAEYTGEWDMLVLASDDMRPVAENWHAHIQSTMEQCYPDGDGCVWFNDGHQNRICTMSMMGRKYYVRFGYLYHPSYISLWCDNEYTEVAQRLKRITRFDICLFKHHHPNWLGRPDLMDKLYEKNEAYYKADERNFNARKHKNFQ
jgi:hypothetical protein